MLILAVLATSVGILLGLLGGGGSILTVPILVYLVGMPAKSAIVTSLIVVGITSSIAVFNHARHDRVCWKTGFVFGLAGMVGAYMGGRAAAFVPDTVLLLLFAVVMLTAAMAMLRSKRSRPTAPPSGNSRFCPAQLPILPIVFDGFLVGLITGLVGVGGGFLLVPALNHLAGLPIHAAIGTSLFIITLQSGAALAGHAGHLNIDLQLTLLFTVCAVIGSFIGSAWSGKISSQSLKQGFGVFVLLLGCFLLYREINRESIAQMHSLIQENWQFIFGAATVVIVSLLYRLWLWVHRLQAQ